MKRTPAIMLVTGLFMLVACGKKVETLDTPVLSEYFPLEVGHSYIYRLDSTVPANFGSVMEVHSYLAKDSIESTFTDNLGRTSFRIFRFLSDTTGQQPWQSNATFFATPTREKLEYVDNNLRYIKLVLPVSEDYTWKGNAYIESQDLDSPVPFLNDWDYTYSNISQPFAGLNKTYDSTVTVLEHDELSPDLAFDPSLVYQQKIFSKAVYASKVGLVYKEFMFYTWQNSSPPGKFEDASYGVKLQLVDYK